MNDGWASVVVKNWFDTGVNLYSDNSVAAGGALYGDNSLILQQLEVKHFDDRSATGTFSDVSTFQSGIQLRSSGHWYARDIMLYNENLHLISRETDHTLFGKQFKNFERDCSSASVSVSLVTPEEPE